MSICRVYYSCKMSAKKVTIYIGDIVFNERLHHVNVLSKGYVIVDRNKILATGKEEDLESTKLDLNLSEDNTKLIILTDSQILIPGLIDTHIHAPQYPNCGIGYDKILLDWLDNYTYKIESKYKDHDFSRMVYDAVVRKTLNNGTTTACYFASLFWESSLILVDKVIEHGQRAFVGKINMTTLAPKDYIETPEETIENTRKFIEAVILKNNDLVNPIITPRFGLSLDLPEFSALGYLAKEYDLHIQSHIGENVDEVKQVTSKYGMSYAALYDKTNLLTPKTVLAHGIYLEEDELLLIRQRGTGISHCPDSNTCLKSGMCDVKKLWNHGIRVSLGTDVSGGSHSSILQTMRAALDLSVHISFQRKDYESLTYLDVFYLATLGGAEALRLEDKIGSFKAGKEFDALIVDMNAKDGPMDYLVPRTALEKLQQFIYTGDDRNIVEVYVAGQLVKKL